MELFADSANLVEIENCLKRGLISGITTNPSIFAKEPKGDFVEHISQIVALCRKHEQQVPLSVEVFATEPRAMEAQARELVEAIAYEQLNIKIPMGWDELEVVYRLARSGVAVNCTCLFTEEQCVMAANAGARYVSIFFGRTRDIGGDPCAVISKTRQLLDRGQSDAEIIVGSIREGRQIIEAQSAGAHIVTAAPKLFANMATHPQTTKSIDGFLADFREWLE